ncbi:MAG: hypothetical protein KGI46_10265 [Alphaproteobacteria bacterium]|nr:hypothetical protein [Alphaproteobacteria bacterium]
MTRMLIAAVTLIGLTTTAMAQGYEYNEPSPYATYTRQQRPMSYGSPYDRPAPAVGN